MSIYQFWISVPLCGRLTYPECFHGEEQLHTHMDTHTHTYMAALLLYLTQSLLCIGAYGYHSPAARTYAYHICAHLTVHDLSLAH